ncbi:hypothetical protein F2Q69_00012912 [Brassica cretica]|uniref:Uncharacterized protein n=1 Tax=Brassica cretica TaxID=69181 RepID=A0A8S9R527_BRACR|nr:hypothetical protein F2Q69_00012912 [Brassica cretica]
MKRFLIWIRLNCPKVGFLFSQQGFSSTTPPGFLFRSDSDNVQVHPNQMDAQGKDKDACRTVRMNVELVGKDELRYGQFGRLVVVPAEAPIGTHAGWLSQSDRSSDLKTSVSWLKDMVKDINRLRLNQNEAGTSSTELDECSGSWARPWSSSVSSGKLDGSSVSVHQLMELDILAHSAGGLEEMDTRQKEKEKDNEKEMALGERTPKDLTLIVVKLRNREDSGHGKMCGVWVHSVRNELMIAYCAN